MLSLALLSLSSCLKDDSYVDFSQVGTIVEFPLGGIQNFAHDAIVDPGPLVTVQFAVNVSSPTIPTTPTTVTIAIDNSITATYLAANPNNKVPYIAFPAGSFSVPTTSVTIPAGSRTGIFTLIVDKSKLNISLSYMIPIKIVSAGGLTVSGNQYIHYFHVIGNDFQGSYLQDFRRYNAADSVSAPLNGQSFTNQPVLISPVTTTQFEMYSGYAGGIVRYEVSYTETGVYPNATYSNFMVSMNSDDITNNFGSSITLTQPPVFLTTYYSPTAQYTFAQAVKLLRFQYIATTSAPRYLIDWYHH